jgi:hypothetical protein
MRHPPDDLLSRAALRFARRYAIDLRVPVATTPGDALSRLLLEPSRRSERARWLRIVAYHRDAHGTCVPASGAGPSNAGRRFLASHGVAAGDVVDAARAARLRDAWDTVGRRVLRTPDAPIWRYEWWVDRRGRYRVSLDFATDGSAAIGLCDCGAKCANVGARSTTSVASAHRSATTDDREAPSPSTDATRTYGVAPDAPGRLVQGAPESTSDAAGHSADRRVSGGRGPPGRVCDGDRRPVRVP